ncbi:MAG: pantetheine-phosphate adenylyltransferase [Catalinimonas sp.]
MTRIAIFPGSFDPFTRGHEDVVRRGLAVFDEVIVGVGVNSNKQRYFPLETILSRIESTFGDTPGVRVVSYRGLTAEFARREGALFLLRGLRNTTDFEYENAIAQANRHVFGGLETVFLITTPGLATISSSIVRDLHRHGQDVGTFLPYAL